MRTSLSEHDLAEAESILGYSFNDRSLLRRALTHSSADTVHNEALATLGDFVHAVWVARRCYAASRRPRKNALTFVINGLRDGRAGQAPIFFGLGLEALVVLGGATLGHGGTVTADMAATAFEALVAAVELDGGRAAAEEFLDRVAGRALAERVERAQFGG